MDPVTATDFVIPLPPLPRVRVAGGESWFPVRRIYCVGRNYAEHAREMGHDPAREAPFFFQKPADAIDQSGRFPYPPQSRDTHHEVELMVYLESGGRDIPAAEALGHVFGYGVGLDMTRRDLQQQAKTAGRPWEVAKAFDHSAPCSDIAPAAAIGHPAAGEIYLDRNGQRAQQGDLSQQTWSVPEIIAHLSALFELMAGDVIMTGTPAGVGAVAVGDRLEAGIAGIGTLRVEVTGAP